MRGSQGNRQSMWWMMPPFHIIVGNHLMLAPLVARQNVNNGS